MHVAWVGAESPEGNGAQFVGGVLRGILDDAVAGTDVVEQEVAVGMDDFVAERIGDGERSAIDDRSGGSRDDAADVAGGTADVFEHSLALLSRRGCGESCVSRGDLGAADELGEVVDVGEAEVIGNVFGICGDFADGGHIVGTQAVGHSHFIQIGVADEG